MRWEGCRCGKTVSGAVTIRAKGGTAELQREPLREREQLVVVRIMLLVVVRVALAGGGLRW